MYHVKNYQRFNGKRVDRGLWRKENGTICLDSNVIRIGEEHTTKNVKCDNRHQQKYKKKQQQKQTSRGRSLSSLGSWPRNEGSGVSLFQAFRLKSEGENIVKEKKTRGDLTAKASVFVRFRSKERGKRVKDRAKMLPETLATQTRGG